MEVQGLHCFGCLGSENVQQFTIECDPLKAIIQVDTIPLCYICKRLAQHTELFILNVQNNQILLENFLDLSISPLKKVHSIQHSMTLSQMTLGPIELTGTGVAEECSVISSKDIEIKLELKEEGLQFLEGELAPEDSDFQLPYLKEEDDLPLNSLKKEITDVDLATLRIAIKKKKANSVHLKGLQKSIKKKKVKKKENSAAEKFNTNSATEKLNNYSTIDKYELPKVNTIRMSEKQCEEERAKMALDQKYLDSLYKCEDCLKGFMVQEAFDRHMERHSLSRGDYVCKICKQRFESSAKLESHHATHFDRYKCYECGIIRRSRKAIHDHNATSHNTKLEIGYTKCPHCPKLFLYKGIALRRHILYRHSPRKRVTCAHCHHTYASKQSLMQHLVRKHPKETSDGAPPKRFVCEECGKAFMCPSQLRHHATTHSDVKNYYCVECDKSFKSDSQLTQHLKNTTIHIRYSELPYTCEQCDKKFTSKRCKNNHVNRIHLNIRPFQCDKCDKSYMNGWTLSEHIRYSHDGAQRPLRYPCDRCDKVFARSQILKSHRRTHTGERPFQCSHCPATFAQRSSMGTHVKLVHLRLTRDGRPKQNK